MEAKSNRDPLRFVAIQADAAAQCALALPMVSTLTHGTDRYGTGSFRALTQIVRVLLHYLTCATTRAPGWSTSLCVVPIGRHSRVATPTCNY